MTAQGSALTRFRRAVERKSLLNAELAAREMGQLNLEDALSLVLLYAAAGLAIEEHPGARSMGTQLIGTADLANGERVSLVAGSILAKAR